MRARLFRAVNAVVTDPTVRDLPDAARLAAIVLLAKANVSRGLWVRCTAAQLGRWLGYTRSHVEHNVLPVLRAAGAVESVVEKDGSEVVGLRLRLTLLTAAHGGNADHPLRLLRQDLAVLLRLLEALIGEGWTSESGRVTPPGLLAARRSRGAATDRLALVLLVLRTRSNGRVCLVGGAVARKKGRPAATVAKVLGCTVDGAKKVLARLRDAGVVQTPRLQAAPGVLGRARLVVPAVAAAHRVAACGRPGAVETCSSTAPGVDAAAGAPMSSVGAQGVDRGQGGSDSGGDLGVDQHPAGAVGHQLGLEEPADAAMPGISGAFGVAGGKGGRHPVGADTHALHALVVTDVTLGTGLESGFSGVGVAGYGSTPELASGREDWVGSDAGRDPLRGEHPRGSTGDVPEDLASVLRPVAWLWSQIERAASRRWLAEEIRRELVRTSGLADDVPAAKALTARLQRRWQAQQGAGVLNPVGWFKARGLPQRSWCWSQLCDEGRRVDTGRPCESCEEKRVESQGLRAWVTARAVAAGVVGQVELDLAVHREVQTRSEEQRARLEAQARCRAGQQAVWAERRERARLEQELRNAVPCSGCGMPMAAGSCPGCAFRASTEEALAEASYLALVEWSPAGPVEPSVARTELGQWRAHFASWVSGEIGEQSDAAGPSAAYTGLQAAERVRDSLRERVLAAFADSPEAREEARRARSCVLGEAFRYATREALEEASAKAYSQAVAKTASFLLRQRLSAFRAATAAPLPERVWKDRLAALAARQLPGEGTCELAVA